MSGAYNKNYAAALQSFERPITDRQILMRIWWSVWIMGLLNLLGLLGVAIAVAAGQ